MKKLLVLSIVAAFACVTAVQAGESSTKASTCSESKTACCASAKKVTKKADTSVKGATLLMARK
jgi:hypothetical protein